MQVKHYVPFTQIENSLIQNAELTIYDKMIYIVLCSHANMNNSCFPSYKTIAKESCCSERQAKLVIKNLEKKGYVIITRRKGDNGKNQSNVYEMMMPLGECNAQG